MIKFFARIWINRLKQVWSDFRWKKLKHITCEKSNFTSNELGHMKTKVNYIYSHFGWVMDNASQLFDTFRPIPIIYNDYLTAIKDNSKFQDDCDGYHSCVYHELQTVKDIDIVLITMVTKPFTQSHTMCLFTNCNNFGIKKYNLINYNQFHTDFLTIDDVVAFYERDNNIKVRCWGLDKYDYEKNKFIHINMKKEKF